MCVIYVFRNKQKSMEDYFKKKKQPSAPPRRLFYFLLNAASGIRLHYCIYYLNFILEFGNKEQ